MTRSDEIRALAEQGWTRRQIQDYTGASKQLVSSALRHTPAAKRGRPVTTCDQCVCGKCGALYRPSRTRGRARH